METKSADSEVLKRASLYRVVRSPEHAAELEREELESLKVAHELEIVSLQGRLDLHPEFNRNEWRARSRHALKNLKLQAQWITDELERRAKAERIARHEKEVQDARRARLDRIAKANEDDRRRKMEFFAVAREVLGLEMYTHIWELANKRAAEAKGENNVGQG